MKQRNLKQLKAYLFTNGIFSGLSGLILLIFTGKISNLFNILHKYVIPVIGVSLLLFALFLSYVAARQLNKTRLVDLIVILDVLWVAGSAMIIILGLFTLSQAGYIILGVVAIWIGFLAYKQYSNS